MLVKENPSGSGVFAEDANGDHQIIPLRIMQQLERLLAQLIEHYGFPSNYPAAKIVFQWLKAEGYFRDFDEPNYDPDVRLQ